MCAQDKVRAQRSEGGYVGRCLAQLGQWSLGLRVTPGPARVWMQGALPDGGLSPPGAPCLAKLGQILRFVGLMGSETRLSRRCPVSSVQHSWPLHLLLQEVGIVPV